MRNTHTSHTRALVLPPFIFTLFFFPEFSPIGYTSHVVISRVRPPASAPFPPSPPLYLRSRGGWRRSASLPLSSLSLSHGSRLISFISLSLVSLLLLVSIVNLTHIPLALSSLFHLSLRCGGWRRSLSNLVCACACACVCVCARACVKESVRAFL